MTVPKQVATVPQPGHGQAMTRREEQRLAIDADVVCRAIRSTPGISSKRAIAEAVGLTEARVAFVVKRIKAGDTGHGFVDYGTVKGQAGWYAMDVEQHHRVLGQPYQHAANIEAILRRRRTDRS